ncbi:hypothetical protein H2199_001599 [Coniosporium tulheliwenetii]|uniref:Uncharacterized protein n=1 Tax=Coniosporium tulheliwenetii TaxID=3383036 RepID=A0ACC2ZJU3_9PEZI|nr:hypothetical protein H2199_001599 [Cladosporium sp. JES 115]
MLHKTTSRDQTTNNPGPIFMSPKQVGYQENGQRWMERQEAQSLRKALEDMDIQEDQHLYSAAQEEASELVWKHQNPNAPYRNPDAPYDYKEHLRKGSHAKVQSIGRGSLDLHRGDLFTKDSTSSASASGGSGRNSLSSTRVPSDSSIRVPDSPAKKQGDEVKAAIAIPKSIPESKTVCPNAPIPAISELPSGRRRSSGSKRKVSGSLFQNPEDQIYEEPEDSSPKPAVQKAPTAAPPRGRRNPFARVQFARENVARSNTEPLLTGKRFDRFEIQRNPPSQSRNPAYTSNTNSATPPRLSSDVENAVSNEEAVKMKDGKEIRGDDIRAATSMKLKDRSPKLPTPTVVSDSPGRPIVSFQSGWKPKEVELKQEESRVLPAAPKITHTSPNPVVKSVIPTINLPDEPGNVSRKPAPSPSPPTISVSPEALIPSINVSSAPPIPTINPPGEDSPAVPSISVSDCPSIPTINLPDAPSIAISAPLPSVPTLSASAPTRPLPQPKTHNRPHPRHAATAPPSTQPHWTPSLRGARTVALCTNCALPIAGRVVSAAGARFHPECFTCHHCGEGLECVAFYPEPEHPFDSQTPFVEKDGYAWCVNCHTNRFSTKCKKCRKPVTDTVVKALGAEWHTGNAPDRLTTDATSLEAGVKIRCVLGAKSGG